MLSIPAMDQNVSEDTYYSAILNLEMSVCNEPLFFCLELCSNVYNCRIILSWKIWMPQKIQYRNCLLDSLMNWQERVQSMTRHKCFLQKLLPEKMWLLGWIHLSHCLEVGASWWKALYIGLNFPNIIYAHHIWCRIKTK